MIYIIISWIRVSPTFSLKYSWFPVLRYFGKDIANNFKTIYRAENSWISRCSFSHRTSLLNASYMQSNWKLNNPFACDVLLKMLQTGPSLRPSSSSSSIRIPRYRYTAQPRIWMGRTKNGPIVIFFIACMQIISLHTFRCTA